MTHRNAPLTPEGRRRLIERCRTRPVAHVAAEMGISRATASKWVNRYRRYGELGLLDRSSAPHRQPTATPGRLVDRIERMRRERKWSASRIAFELEQDGTPVSRRTITRLLAQLGLNRRRFIDPTGETNREPQQIMAARPGHPVCCRPHTIEGLGGSHVTINWDYWPTLVLQRNLPAWMLVSGRGGIIMFGRSAVLAISAVLASGCAGQASSTTPASSFSVAPPVRVDTRTMTPAPPPGPPPTLTRTTLTSSDNGATVLARPGQQISVTLQPALGNWVRPQISGQGVLRPVSVSDGYPSPRPLHAVYLALTRGEASIATQTDLACFHTTPRCGAPAQGWRVKVVVQVMRQV
jgi:transposase